MNKNSLLLAGSLLLSCQDEKLQNLKQLPFHTIKIEIPKLGKKEEHLEEKVEPKGQQCTIDLSNRFIPELLSLSRDADQYFLTNDVLKNPFQRERFGIFSSFAHHQKSLEHYSQAIEKRGKEVQPKIEVGFIPYTNEGTIKKISNLEKQLQDPSFSAQKAKLLHQEQAVLEKQIETIKKVQKILQWENFYQGEIQGLYDSKTSLAVVAYQKYHRQRLLSSYVTAEGKFYELKTDGAVSRATQELLNKDFEEYAFSGVRRVLEERVFHAKCKDQSGNERSPYVIEPAELEKLTDHATAQLHLNTVEGWQHFFSTEHSTATVFLEIPERYQRDSMKFEIDVEKWDAGKWERVRTKTNLRLYAIEDGKRVEVFGTKAVVGGWVKNKSKGTQKQYHTPERQFFLKSMLVLPHWNPPQWAAAEEEVKEEEKLPGPFNAFGMLNTPLYYDNKTQKDPFRGWQDGDNGYRIHLTPWPSSVEYGGSSHGCIRIHPNMSRFFYFVTGYTPHKTILEDFEGRKTLKFTPFKGSIIAYDPEYYIKVRTCEEKCE